MKKIKLSFPYPNFPLIKQTPGSNGRWGDYQFYINEDVAECDYWVVFNFLLKEREQTKCSSTNTIFITAEPFSIHDYNDKFVKQFAKVITCQRELKHSDVTYYLQGQPWHIGLQHSNHHKLSADKSYDELKALIAVPKTKELSLITSDKQFTAGHRKRYQFVKAIKNYFGERVDLFGRGLNEVDNKWDALAPYKYSLAIENSAYPDYITEKLFDCYLAQTFPLYYGCPNIKDYFSPDAYLNIAPDDLRGSIKIIEQILHDKNHYQQHLPALLAAKELCLDRYNLFPLIVNFIERRQADFGGAPEPLTLKQNHFSVNYWRRKFVKKIKNFYV